MGKESNQAACRYCGSKLGLMQRLSGQEFCSTEHRLEFNREHEEMALARLQTLGPEPPPQQATRKQVAEPVPELASEPAPEPPTPEPAVPFAAFLGPHALDSEGGILVQVELLEPQPPRAIVLNPALRFAPRTWIPPVTAFANPARVLSMEPVVPAIPSEPEPFPRALVPPGRKSLGMTAQQPVPGLLANKEAQVAFDCPARLVHMAPSADPWAICLAQPALVDGDLPAALPAASHWIGVTAKHLNGELVHSPEMLVLQPFLTPPESPLESLTEVAARRPLRLAHRPDPATRYALRPQLTSTPAATPVAVEPQLSSFERLRESLRNRRENPLPPLPAAPATASVFEVGPLVEELVRDVNEILAATEQFTVAGGWPLNLHPGLRVDPNRIPHSAVTKVPLPPCAIVGDPKPVPPAVIRGIHAGVAKSLPQPRAHFFALKVRLHEIDEPFTQLPEGSSKLPLMPHHTAARANDSRQSPLPELAGLQLLAEPPALCAEVQAIQIEPIEIAPAPPLSIETQPGIQPATGIDRRSLSVNLRLQSKAPITLDLVPGMFLSHRECSVPADFQTDRKLPTRSTALQNSGLLSAGKTEVDISEWFLEMTRFSPAMAEPADHDHTTGGNLRLLPRHKSRPLGGAPPTGGKLRWSTPFTQLTGAPVLDPVACGFKSGGTEWDSLSQ